MARKNIGKKIAQEKVKSKARVSLRHSASATLNKRRVCTVIVKKTYWPVLMNTLALKGAGYTEKVLARWREWAGQEPQPAGKRVKAEMLPGALVADKVFAVDAMASMFQEVKKMHPVLLERFRIGGPEGAGKLIASWKSDAAKSKVLHGWSKFEKEQFFTAMKKIIALKPKPRGK